MFIPWEKLAAGQLGTEMWMKGAEKNHRRLVDNYARVATGEEFWVRGQLLENVYTFKYPGRNLSFDERNWPAVIRNLQRA